MPDGPRELEGYWVNSVMTPLERPADLGDKAFFDSEREARQWRDSFLTRLRERTEFAARVSPEFDDIWTEPGDMLPSLRTSLIVDPANGRLPLRVAGRTADPERRPLTAVFDNPEDLPASDRCLVWGEGPPMVPNPIFSYLQILQPAGYVLIFKEMIHNARIIPLDGRPHAPATIRRWTGDSRGRWDGNTLVVDTTNFTDKTQWRGSTAALHVVERFTRADADRLPTSLPSRMPRHGRVHGRLQQY
jgi:hypothetical protein